jgi:hypothetical protein
LLASGDLKAQIEEISFADVVKGLELLGSGKVANQLYTIPRFKGLEAMDLLWREL